MEENKAPLYDEEGRLLEESFMPEEGMGELEKEERQEKGENGKSERNSASIRGITRAETRASARIITRETACFSSAFI